MLDAELPWVAADTAAKPLHAVRPDGLETFLAALAPWAAAYLRDTGFAAKPQELVLLPGPDGVAGAVLGIGDDRSPHVFGDLPYRLPQGAAWRFAPGDFDAEAAVLGYLLGAYRFRTFKPPKREPAKLVRAGDGRRTASLAAATWMVRDLINTPANLLGPQELAHVAHALAARHGAAPHYSAGADLARDYPMIAAVGAGSVRPPVVAGFSWRGSAATADSPLVALCGKGVVFDTGGYDIKPADGMLRMKKDMGGAATILGIARALMETDLPIRLLVRVGCVENSISGSAMRPLDVVRTRRGLSVEIGNTDAEGRLVLADLLAEASDLRPSLLLDCATLTGAARVALGPDIVPMFTNDARWAEWLAEAGEATHDPLWRLPLWPGYAGWLDSPVADINNIAGKPFAGAIVAALFLQRFVAAETPWVHLDLYAWNDATRPGRPEGGEAQALRAACHAIEHKLVVTIDDRNTGVT
jgi:leucyl aminopeptidase